MYYIYFKRSNNSKFEVGANISLKSVDDETTRRLDREDLLFNVRANRTESLPLDLSEKAYILKVENDEDTEIGEVLYSDSRDILDFESNKENILKNCSTYKSMISFLERYLQLTLSRGIQEKIIDESKKILALLKDKHETIFEFAYAYLERLLDEMVKDYEAYRFAYLANKSLELEKKEIKYKTKNMTGKRKTKRH